MRAAIRRPRGRPNRRRARRGARAAIRAVIRARIRAARPRPIRRMARAARAARAAMDRAMRGRRAGPGWATRRRRRPTRPTRICWWRWSATWGPGRRPRRCISGCSTRGADLLIVLGDFDYGDDPAQFFKDMEGVLGGTFPVFGVIGNHDVAEWDGYQSGLKARLAKVQGAACTGDLGVDSSCKYRGLHFVLSGVGTIGTKAKHEQYIADALAADDSLWSLCIWHKNMRDLQAGDKSDDVGWPAFKHCQKEGAPIVMGHEHSYARTPRVDRHRQQGQRARRDRSPGAARGRAGPHLHGRLGPRRQEHPGLRGCPAQGRPVVGDALRLRLPPPERRREAGRLGRGRRPCSCASTSTATPRARTATSRPSRGEVIDEFDVVKKQ
jgi:hypothetical protein